MAPRGYVTPSSRRSQARSPYAPSSYRSRRRTPIRVSGTMPRRVFRPITNSYIHEFKHTLPFALPITYSSGGANSRGFILPGTAAGTSNWGLRWSFTPSGVTVVNNNAGVSSKLYNNLSAFQSLFQEVRIKNVKFQVFFTANSSNTDLGTSVSRSPMLPVLVAAVVLDLFEPVPGTQTALLDYPQSFARQCGQSVSSSGSMMDMSFTPKTFTSLTGSSPQVAVPSSSWLSVDNGGMLQDHAGMLWALDEFSVGELQPNGTYGGSFSVHVEMTVQFKGLK